MKHNAFTALSMAAALVVAGSAQATEFEIDFEPVGVTDYALSPANGWTVQTGDASAVVATNNTRDANSTMSLLLDTGDDELNYAPTSAVVSVLSMDVCFVGAEEDPSTSGFTGQTMVYLNSTNNTLYAYVGNSWITLTNGIVDGSWHSLGMTFDYTAKTVDFSVDGHTVATDVSMGNDSSFQKVTSVGFKGTGMVDNFVGDKAGIPADVDGTANAVATYDNGTVNVTFSGYEGTIQFIEVEDSAGKVVRLRGSKATAAINAAKLNGSIVRVSAFTSGSAIPTGTSVSASAVAVDTTEQKPQIKITVPNAVSGLYYTPFGPDGKALADSVVILPEDHGDPATLSVPAVTGDWGVVKFQIVASDEEYEAGENLQPNN